MLGTVHVSTRVQKLACFEAEEGERDVCTPGFFIQTRGRDVVTFEIYDAVIVRRNIEIKENSRCL